MAEVCAGLTGSEGCKIKNNKRSGSLLGIEGSWVDRVDRA